MTHDILALVRQLQEAAVTSDMEFKGHEAACVTGMLRAYFRSMHAALPDDHFLKEYIPDELAKEIDKINERAVMKKLAS
jgi:hypothetical protein